MGVGALERESQLKSRFQSDRASEFQSSLAIDSSAGGPLATIFRFLRLGR